MLLRTGRWMLMIGAATSASTMMPVATPVQAQNWNGGGQSCWNLKGRDRERCEAGNRWSGDRNGGWDRNRRERERDRRKDAKTDGIVAGVLGTAILGGIIVAATSGNKKKDERRTYCEDRYGNYDARTDTYRADDGRSYRCE